MFSWYIYASKKDGINDVQCCELALWPAFTPEFHHYFSIQKCIWTQFQVIYFEPPIAIKPEHSVAPQTCK